MRKGILLVAVILFGTVVPVFAEDAQQGNLRGSVGLTYDTFHVWRGFLTWGHHSGTNTFIDLDLMGSGFGFRVDNHFANASGHNGPEGYHDGERWDYSPYYRNILGDKNDQFATEYQLSYVYYNYPHTGQGSGRFDADGNPTHISQDLQELNALLSWPNITGIKGLVPRYCLVKLWSSSGDSSTGGHNPNGGSANGFAHIFMLDYGLPIPGLTSETPEQTLNFHTELVWNDGVDPRAFGGYKSSDWTDFVFGVSTDFKLGNNFFLTPGVFHQITMEDDGNKGVSPDHDMTWASLTATCKF